MKLFENFFKWNLKINSLNFTDNSDFEFIFIYLNFIGKGKLKTNYKEIRTRFKLNCHRRTVNNVGLKNGYRVYRAKRKPKLAEAVLKDCRDFASFQMGNQKIDSIIFTEEKTFFKNIRIIKDKNFFRL